MKLKQFNKKVLSGKFPLSSVELYEKFIGAKVIYNHACDNVSPYDMDKNSYINNISHDPLNGISSIAHIHSSSGTMRANHYHETDYHYTYVIRGKVLYLQKDANEENETHIKVQIFDENSMFFTPPMFTHVMLFLKDSDIMTFSKNDRNHQSHEDDVVRVNFLSQKEARKIYLNYHENQFLPREIKL